MDVTLETEIRHLPYSITSKLGEISQIGKCWKDVMGLIPKDLSIMNRHSDECDYPKKYSSENINLVSQICSTEGLNGMEVLIEEWGTSGMTRPKVFNLIWVLEKASQLRAASLLKELIDKHSDSNSHSSESLTENNACHVPHAVLAKATSQFSDVPLEDGGSCIGKGAFGIVYKGIINKDSKPVIVAIKKLNQKEAKTEKQFLNELKLLQTCVHPNVLRLEGFSLDGENWCLIYEFMENGSLSDHLASSGNPCLTWEQRLKISEGSAEGIAYLHSLSPPLVHRDIKSPNILLDENFNAKIGDFGLVRFGGKGTQTAVQTTVAFGTSAYMAPEAFRGDVSIKMDTFSYGVVLLEMLTGLPSYDEDRDGIDLLTHVIDYEGEDEELLDPKPGFIDQRISRALFDLAFFCTKEKKCRPTMDEVLVNLRNVIASFSL